MQVEIPGVLLSAEVRGGTNGHGDRGSLQGTRYAVPAHS